MATEYFLSKYDIKICKEILNINNNIVDTVAKEHILAFTDEQIIEQKDKLTEVWEKIHILLKNDEIETLPAFTVLLLNRNPEHIYTCLNFIYYVKDGKKIYLNQIEDNEIPKFFSEYVWFNLTNIIKKSPLDFNLKDISRTKLNHIICELDDFDKIENELTKLEIDQKHPLFEIIYELNLENKRYINYYNINKAINKLFKLDMMHYETILGMLETIKFDICEESMSYTTDEEVIENCEIINERITKNQKDLEFIVKKSDEAYDSIFNIVVEEYFKRKFKIGDFS